MSESIYTKPTDFTPRDKPIAFHDALAKEYRWIRPFLNIHNTAAASTSSSSTKKHRRKAFASPKKARKEATSNSRR